MTLLAMWRFEALVHTVAFTLAEMNAGTHGKSLVDVEADALIDTMADNLAEAKFETLGDTLGEAKSGALVDTLAETYQRRRPRHLATHCEFCSPRH